MQHIALSIVTMAIVWYAWINFKKIGRLRAADIDLTDEERQRQQMTYIMRIVVCLLSLAILPFLFTVLTDL
jgi:cbb3-type cytochrome oxidase subunit 3